jgi:hypothetical protein
VRIRFFLPRTRIEKAKPSLGTYCRSSAPAAIHSESRFYLATYDVTAAMLTASLQTIGNAAKKIISLIENSGQQIYRHESKSRKDDGYRDLFLPMGTEVNKPIS